MARQKVNKPTPIERFPTKPRKDGRFQKRIRNHLYYFGSGDGDRAAALREYELVKHDLYSGRTARRNTETTATTVSDICNKYLADRDADAEAGRITRRHYEDIQYIRRRFCKFNSGGMMIGLRSSEDLRPEDFAAYGRYLHRLKLGSHAFNRERASIHACFRHAVACDWLDRPIKFGRGFQKISASKIRGDRQQKLMLPIHIKSVLVNASPTMWLMTMLGILGGFGPGDCCKLKTAEIDWEQKFIRSRRSKTKIRRDTPLTQELIDGLRIIMANRPDDSMVFRTVRGNVWDTTDVDHEFNKLIRGFTPYDLRRAFLTYANETGDSDAVRRIAGWKLTHMNDVYVANIFDTRLRVIVEHVRGRVLG